MIEGDLSDLFSLTRLAGRPEALAAGLDWLLRQGAETAAVLDADGTVLCLPASGVGAGPGRGVGTGPGRGVGAGPTAGAVLRAAGDAVPELDRRGVAASVLPGDRLSPLVHLVSLGTGGHSGKGAKDVKVGAPYLAVTGCGGRVSGGSLTDVARFLGLLWRLEKAERDCRRRESADAHSREAVLHLLMIGDVPPAQRIAVALQPPLPASVHVLVVECPVGRRNGIAEHITRLTGGKTWIVPCPVRPRHLIALPPGASCRASAGACGGDPVDWFRELASLQQDPCPVGVSEEVPLRDVSVGYEQAFHALAVARDLPEGCSRFGRPVGIAPLLSADSRAWARTVLEPCLTYVPRRRAAPGAAELLGTLSSWLSFGSAAHLHLKVHRNTLAARLRLIASLLAPDLGSTAGQAAVWLALRVHTAAAVSAAGTPGSAHGVRTLADVLATPPAKAWAHRQLAELERPDLPVAFASVRAWLQADTRLPATAAALGVSPAAARKRLVRAERALGRSLLQAPSAKYELWLAVTALNRW
ncbi:helix-turn-helix domain-containing protein [Streptomyces sp. MUM 178J]|uniref:helix-turn-helix domain-containing protein n=1 Tax=Streptomyces sp. MUM 178J TaxID=2791991 RepID=UPI001F04E1C1|nr:helix-turn-helix domain-containing protein [Streptomyces sp. MUM 178J]WRQ79721.1 helix-turn-helix domain-containing protein [Streptomyces sp. MUM 178J]